MVSVGRLVAGLEAFRKVFADASFVTVNVGLPNEGIRYSGDNDLGQHLTADQVQSLEDAGWFFIWPGDYTEPTVIEFDFTAEQ